VVDAVAHVANRLPLQSCAFAVAGMTTASAPAPAITDIQRRRFMCAPYPVIARVSRSPTRPHALMRARHVRSDADHPGSPRRLVAGSAAA
jgi:hypothetical protein